MNNTSPPADGGAGPGPADGAPPARDSIGAPVLRIDPAHPTPPYEQLRTQILGLTTAGILTAGSRLPTVRQLAGDLGLAAGTVARAYAELEAAGVLVGRGRRGTFVAPQPTAEGSDDRVARQQALAAAASTYAAAARALGMNAAAAEAALRAAVSQADGWLA